MKMLLSVACLIAIIAEIMMNIAMKTLTVSILLFSLIGCFLRGSIKSIVIVEPLVSTSDESVDIDADRTSTITIPTINAGSVESI